MNGSSIRTTLAAFLAVAFWGSWIVPAASAEPKPPDLDFPVPVGTPADKVQKIPAVVRIPMFGEDKPVYLIDEPKNSFFTQTQYWTQHGQVSIVATYTQTDAQHLDDRTVALLRAAVKKWGKDFLVASSSTHVNGQERLAVSLIWRQESQLVWVGYTPAVRAEQSGSLVVRVLSKSALPSANGIGLPVQKLDLTVHEKSLTLLRQVAREEKVHLQFYDPQQHAPSTPKAD